MTKRKREKKEQEKIKLWKMQGLSDAEIDKKLKKFRLGENIKTAVKWTVVGGAVITFGFGVYKVADKIISNQQNKLSPEEQKDLEEKKKEEEKLLEDISNDVPDKNPDDIVIPKIPTKEEGATEEEIAEAEKKAEEAKQEKEFWTSVKETKEKITENISDQITEMTKNNISVDELPNYLKGFERVRRINNAYAMNDGSLLVDCDYLYLETFANGESVLRQMNATFRFVNENLPSIFNTTQDIINFMTNESTRSEMFGMNEGVELEELNDVFNNHICNLGTLGEYAEKGAKIELEKITAYEYEGNCPIRYYSIAKITDGEKIIYVASDVASDVKTSDFTMEEWRAWAKNPDDIGGVFCDYEFIFSPINLDWKALYEEYSGQQSSQEEEQTAEAASFETTNEQGEVDGFDWNAYRARMQQKEEEEQKNYAQQNVVDTTKVLYDDFELGL